MRQKWIEQSAKVGTVQLVEQKDNRYLYVTKSKSYDGRSAMWHVWVDDKWLTCTSDYQLAIRKFKGEEYDK